MGRRLGIKNLNLKKPPNLKG
ncbi:polymorphic outer membrane protein, partial [Chlamydia psittaci C6/98]